MPMIDTKELKIRLSTVQPFSDAFTAVLDAAKATQGPELSAALDEVERPRMAYLSACDRFYLAVDLAVVLADITTMR